jgi:hypothetical protein
MPSSSKYRFVVSAIFLLLTAGLTPGESLAAAGPVVGKPAPEFSGTDSAGRVHRLSDHRGKIVILEWTNHGCPFVAKHYGSKNMQRTQKDMTESGVVWYSIVSSAPGRQGHVTGPEADDLTRGRGAHPTAVLLDPSGRIGHLYRAVVTPHIFIIDEAGTLVYNGAIDNIPSWDEDDISRATNYVRKAMSKLKAGLPVDPRITRPYGCSVKYGS